MDDLGDVDIKHERSNPYGQPLSNPVNRMPPAETSVSYSYPHPPGQTMPPPAPSWNPTPSPYNESVEHRQPPPPPPPDMAHQSPYHPSHQSYPSHPPQARDTPAYHPDPTYGRPGSVSGPTRSPAEQSPYHPGSAHPHEASYYPPPADYRQRHDYPGPPPPPPQSNGIHQQPLHVVTASHEIMQGHPPGPPQYGPHSAGPPSAGPYSYGYPGPYEQRRKPVRAAQACDSCRQRKAKCDEGRPECQHCKDNGLKCAYRDIPPQKSEKQVLHITGQLDALSEDMKMIVQKSEKSDERFLTLDARVKSTDEKMNLLLDHLMQRRGTPVEQMTDPPNNHFSRLQARSSPTQHHALPAAFRRHESSDVRSGSNSNNPLEKSLAKINAAEANLLSQDTPMPAKHTTAAQNLLEWPSIKSLIPKGTTPSYVMDEETSRGLLRLYGCGEGEDRNDGHEGAPSPAHSSSSEGRRMEDELSSSPHGVWGSGQLHLPSSSNNTNARDHAGGLSPRGGLMLDSDAIDIYFRSFMDHMHIHHPFLESTVIRKMVHTFKRKYSWDFRATQQVAAALGGKRKREMTESPTPMDDYIRQPPKNPIPVMKENIEHSVTNAIVLLVLAIGKITAHRDPLPGPPSTAIIHTSTPHSAMYSDLPLPQSAPNSPFNNSVHINGHNGNVSSPANPQGKNMDVIPGLAYFAKAADIIGELPGGSDVSHIQAYLLAGLYMGQNARIVPCHYYINKACNAIQILIESTEYVKNTMKPSRRNLVNFAFWSCLQLESDIAAEMGLPLSGIGRFEAQQMKEMPTNISLVPIPESRADIDPMLLYYSFQIQLRRTINSVHASVYRESKDNNRPTQSLMETLDMNLEGWRVVLQKFRMDWDDNDHISPDIQVARLRGKYYGAKYIIWRPALRFALEEALHIGKRQHSESPSDYHASDMTSPSMSSFQLDQYGNYEIREENFEGAKKCVEAAVRSTTSFDGVDRRLVVTNIFGTVHAQFGNMLVLYATFTSPHPKLSALVPHELLIRLHERTVKILRENEAISPVLARDLKILEHVRKTVFSHSSYQTASTATSFSSNR